jgi:hypothetical protein
VFVLYFIFPLALLWLLSREKLPTNTHYLYLIGITYKIMAAFAMTYIQINFYDFGDLYTYFLAAKELSTTFFSGDLDLIYFQRSKTVAFFNAIVFLVFPPSIYGLAVISGCSSFIYCVLIVKTIERHFQVSAFAKLIVFFLPTLSLQSGYIGKETYVLPLIGLIVFWLTSDSRRKLLWISAALAVIAIIRPYQAAFIAAALSIAWALEKNQARRIPLSGLLLAAIAMTAYDEFIRMSDDLALFGGFGDLLEVVYSGGNLILEPYPFPFSILQSFRPFPWEAHNLFALISSLECLLVLVYVVGRGIARIRDPFVPWTLEQRRLGFFLFASLAIYLIVFSFNSNMGDLSRRHIYYYPFLLLAFSRPRPLPGDGSRGQHAASRPIGVGAT